jgi:sugar lactone lactonase YvrE
VRRVSHLSRRQDGTHRAAQGRPNGIAFSPAGDILYVANSDERNVRAYDLDKGGTAAN